jgi:hypothetical protein
MMLVADSIRGVGKTVVTCTAAVLLLLSVGCGGRTDFGTAPSVDTIGGGGEFSGVSAIGGAAATSGGVASGAPALGGNSNSVGGAKGGAFATGGLTTSLGGKQNGAGGAIQAGGRTTTIIGGTSAGENSAIGNSSSIGGHGTTGGYATTGGATAAGTPTISESGYVALSAGTVILTGFIASSTAGSGSSISLTYGSNSFCASGTVAANSTYQSWAEAGFQVNQAQSGASGSSNSKVITGSTMSMSYLNNAGSTLEFQLYDGSNYWCYYLPTSTGATTTTIAFSSLKTQCWNDSGSSFTSGTPITAVQLVLGGSATSATPFNFCFLGLTIQ